MRGRSHRGVKYYQIFIILACEYSNFLFFLVSFSIFAVVDPPIDVFALLTSDFNLFTTVLDFSLLFETQNNKKKTTNL